MRASPATQNPLSHRQVSSFSSSGINLYILSFLRPPRGYLKTKKVLHTFKAHLVDRAGFEPAAFRSSQAERLCEPNVLRPDARQYTRLNYRPQNRRSPHTS